MSMMIMIALCFAGLFCMFFFLLRGQEIMLKKLRDELIQNRTHLHAIEARLATLLGEEVSPLPSNASTSMPNMHTSDANTQKLQSLSFTNTTDNTDNKGRLDLRLP